jgi:hypothetical protein
MTATLNSDSPLDAEVNAMATGPGDIRARETRDGDAWLVVEFPGYGTVILPAGDFTES